MTTPSTSPEKTPLLPPPPTAAAAALPKRGAALSPEKAGYVCMLVSALCFATASTLARAAQATYHLPPLGALQTRATLQLVLTLALFPAALPARVVRAHLRLPRNVVLLLLARGVAGAFVLQLSFAGLRLMPAGDAAAVFFTVPLFALAFGALVLGEAVTRADAAAAALSLSGVVLVAMPWRRDIAAPGAADAVGATAGVAVGVVSDRVLGAACMAAAACLSGVAVTLVRLIGDRVHCLASVLAQGLCATVLATALGGVVAVADAGRPAVLAMLASAAFAFAGQVAMDRGMQLARVGAGMLVGNVEVPLTYLTAVIGLGETPGPVQGAGAVLVIFACSVLGLQKI